MFFESRGWLDSDCEDDFHSVNGGNHITRHAYQLSKRDFIQVLECNILVCKLYWLFILIFTIVLVLWFMLFPFEAVLLLLYHL
jgi:hypothetical protein